MADCQAFAAPVSRVRPTTSSRHAWAAFRQPATPRTGNDDHLSGGHIADAGEADGPKGAVLAGHAPLRAPIPLPAAQNQWPASQMTTVPQHYASASHRQLPTPECKASMGLDVQLEWFIEYHCCKLGCILHVACVSPCALFQHAPCRTLPNRTMQLQRPTQANAGRRYEMAAPLSSLKHAGIDVLNGANSATEQKRNEDSLE